MASTRSTTAQRDADSAVPAVDRFVQAVGDELLRRVDSAMTPHVEPEHRRAA